MLEKLLSWLRKEVVPHDYFVFIGLLATSLICSVIVVTFIETLFNIAFTELITDQDLETPFLIMTLYVIAAVILEEVIFRAIPLWIGIKKLGISKLLLGFAVLISALFGLVHGGLENIVVQGATGMVFALIFIKFSRQGTAIIRATTASVAAHILFNMTLVSLLYALE